MTMRTVLVLVWKEYLHVFRDRATIFQVIAIPMIQLVVLGFAATFEVRATPVHVVDADRTAESARLVQRFAASDHFRVVGTSASIERADRAILSGDVTMVLHVPRGFEEDLVAHRATPVQLVLNAEQGAAAGIVRSYATRILADHAAAVGTTIAPTSRPVAGTGEGVLRPVGAGTTSGSASSAASGTVTRSAAGSRDRGAATSALGPIPPPAEGTTIEVESAGGAAADRAPGATGPAAVTSSAPGPAELPASPARDAATGPPPAFVETTGSGFDGDAGAASGAALPVPATTRTPRIDLRSRGWYNPYLDYADYMVPGILVALVTIIGTLLTAQNITREKELGTLEQLNVTPITRTQFIAGKLIPFWILGMLELAIGLGLARLVFDIPLRGNPALVFAVAAVYLVGALAIGLLISTVAHTQQQAMFVTFFVMMVYLLMSGLYTPLTSMPGWARTVAELVPVKHFVVVVRAVLVKGAGPAEIAVPFAALTAFAAAMLLLAVRQYSKRSV